MEDGMILNTPMPPSQFGFDPCLVNLRSWVVWPTTCSINYMLHDGNGNIMGSNVFNAHHIINSTKLCGFTNIFHMVIFMPTIGCETHLVHHAYNAYFFGQLKYSLSSLQSLFTSFLPNELAMSISIALDVLQFVLHKLREHIDFYKARFALSFSIFGVHGRKRRSNNKPWWSNQQLYLNKYAK